MEGRTLVSEAVLAGAELSEVASCLGYHVVVELEFDTTCLSCDWRY
jgi:hypothetical protein